MNALKFLLLPFSILFGILTLMRNKCFDWGLFRAYTPPVPSIGVGNLSAGGTGKSPIATLIAKHFSEKMEVVFISRGYGRRTRGYRMAGKEDNSETIGDEPFQIMNNLSKLKIVVDHNRVRAVKRVLGEYPHTGLIIFDDIMQHRKIRSGFNILLTEYSRPFYKDFLLPIGRLREFSSGKKRSDMIIMTKTPAIFSPIEKRHLTEAIGALPGQAVLFSFIRYTGLIPFISRSAGILPLGEHLNKNIHVVAFCGIGNPGPFEDFLRWNSASFKLLTYPDHHHFSKRDLEEIKTAFRSVRFQEKILLCTEKDMARLQSHQDRDILSDCGLYAIKIEPAFHSPDDLNFYQMLESYVFNN